MKEGIVAYAGGFVATFSIGKLSNIARSKMTKK
jgi:hypothetical protein